MITSYQNFAAAIGQVKAALNGGGDEGDVGLIAALGGVPQLFTNILNAAQPLAGYLGGGMIAGINTLLKTLCIVTTDDEGNTNAGGGNTLYTALGSVYGLVYRGTLDIVTGVLTVDRKKLTLQPNMGWSKSSAFSGGYYCAANLRRLKDFTAFLCSHAKYAASLSEYVRGTCFCDRSINFRLLGEDSTLQDWLDYITNNEVSIVGFLAEPVTYQLTGTQVTTLLGLNHIWADTGDVSLSYRADTKLYIDNAIAQKSAKSTVTPYITDTMTAPDNITAGSLVLVGDDLYKVTANVASGGALTIGTNVSKITLAEYIIEQLSA